jgi:hypothetical protein
MRSFAILLLAKHHQDYEIKDMMSMERSKQTNEQNTYNISVENLKERAH